LKRLALLALLLCMPFAPVFAQDPAPAACPHASEVGQTEMLGLWHAVFADQDGATLLFEKHPVYSESLSGAVNRNGERRPVVGDVEDGNFTLEESADGVHIAATWLGELVEGSCGREIRGTWQAEGDQAPRYFLMTKL
jgi:hypothetical protein